MHFRDFISTFPMFRSFPPALRQALVMQLQQSFYRQHDAIVDNTTSDSVYFIASGTVKVRTNSSSRSNNNNSNRYTNISVNTNNNDDTTGEVQTLFAGNNFGASGLSRGWNMMRQTLEVSIRSTSRFRH